MQLTSDWDTSEEFSREFYLKDSDGRTIERFQDYPSLNELRRAEKKHDERIVLTEIGVPCANCDSEIRGRFAANPQSNLLCWDCATTAGAIEEAGVRVNTDPTKATVSESKLYEKSLCDYVVNVATGCRHGCKFCYVPTTPGYEGRSSMIEEQAGVENLQGEWGSYLLYRDDIPERLHEQLNSGQVTVDKRTERGRGVVMLSSGTDPYQDRRAAQISRSVIYELTSREIPVRVLTRSSTVIQDVGLFQQARNLVTVGSSIPSFNESVVSCLEPGAPPPLTRWEALDMLQLEDVPVFVSMSPTYPTMTDHGLHRLLTRFKALGPKVVFHEPINPRGKNFEMIVQSLRADGLDEAAGQFERLQDPAEWVEYALKHINWVHEKAESLGDLPIHTWPDNALIRATDGVLRDQLKAMQQSLSPETFRGNDAPEIHRSQSPIFDDFQEITDLVKPRRIRRD